MADPPRTQTGAFARELERVGNPHFLEALMAASAFIALADREIRESELAELDAVLDHLRGLAGFDAGRAKDLYRSYADAIRADRNSGQEKVLEAVGKLAGDEETASLLLRVCMAIGKADGAFSHSEYAAISELGAAAGIDLTALER